MRARSSSSLVLTPHLLPWCFDAPGSTEEAAARVTHVLTCVSHTHMTAPSKLLPEWLAYAAPESWGVDFSQARPQLLSTKYDLLIFAVLRQLLNARDLDTLFLLEDGDLGVRRPPLDCLTSVGPAGPRRTIESTPSRRGRSVAEPSSTAAVRQRKLQDFKLPACMIGIRLKYHKDRWCLAPPALGVLHRHKLASEVAQSEVADSEQNPDICSILNHKRAALSSTPSFRAVSRLLAFWSSGDPLSEVPLAPGTTAHSCHFRCCGSRTKRALCLNPSHISWGDQSCNSYHKVIHDANETPQKLRPHGWVAPSKRPDYKRPKRRRLSF